MDCKPLQVMAIFGTRPEAIKLAPVIAALKAHPACEVAVVVTAQHREMLDTVLSSFNIVPDIDLNIMQKGQTLSSLTARCMEALGTLLETNRPDRIIVHGDTTTTFVSTLAAFYHHIPIAHIEAGLRSGNFLAPWPEEANRTLTGVLADLHFAPTVLAKKNLLAEGVRGKILVTGNTAVDTVMSVKNAIENDTVLREMLFSQFAFLNSLEDANRHLILVTGHRRENHGDSLEAICQALKMIAEDPNFEIVYPVHLNPNVRNTVFSMVKNMPNVHLIEPVDYVPFVFLMQQSRLILTDSGGIQEEAPSLKKRVLLMRDVTERPEGVAAGCTELVGANAEYIVKRVREEAIQAKNTARAFPVNPFGDGKASDRIVKGVLQAHGKIG